MQTKAVKNLTHQALIPDYSSYIPKLKNTPLNHLVPQPFYGQGVDPSNLVFLYSNTYKKSNKG
jgi:hypothetical protein